MFVISDHLEGVFGSLKLMSPFIENQFYCLEFGVANTVILEIKGSGIQLGKCTTLLK